jgi:hypothetical protein
MPRQQTRLPLQNAKAQAHTQAQEKIIEETVKMGAWLGY